jgi:hypothetical protein
VINKQAIDTTQIQKAESIANRCRDLYLHLESTQQTQVKDYRLARYYEDRLGSRDGNFSNDDLLNAENLLSRHRF